MNMKRIVRNSAIRVASVLGLLLCAIGYAAMSQAATCTVTQNFDGVTPPTFPLYWWTTFVPGASPWETSNLTSDLFPGPDSQPNYALATSSYSSSLNDLHTPFFVVHTAEMTLRFSHDYDFHSPDPSAADYGGVLGLNVVGRGSGEFELMGGKFLTGGYNSTIGSTGGNPFAGKSAWSGDSGGYYSTTLRLPPSLYGAEISLAWTFASSDLMNWGFWAVDSFDCAQVGPSSPWTDAPDYPIGIYGPAMAAVNDVMYSFGGDAGAGPATAAYAFDGTAWQPVAALPEPLVFASAVTDGTSIYILGGVGASSVSNALYKFDPHSDTYTQLASFSMPVAVTAAAYLNGKIYKFAGYTGGTTDTDVMEIYDVATDTWSFGSHYPLIEQEVAAFVRDGYIYSAGGINLAGNVATDKSYRYSPATDSWDDASIPDLPEARYGRAHVNLGAQSILLGGGFSGAVLTNTVVAWDGTAATWRSLAPMFGNQGESGAAVLRNMIYVVGDDHFTRAVEKYDRIFDGDFDG